MESQLSTLGSDSDVCLCLYEHTLRCQHYSKLQAASEAAARSVTRQAAGCLSLARLHIIQQVNGQLNSLV